MARRKAPAQDAPQTLDEAIVLLTDYAILAAQVSEVEALREDALARINAAHDATVALAETSMKALFNRLKPWWAVARDALTEGKRKSIELGGCVIGQRTPPPSLKAPTPEAVALAALRVGGWNGFIRERPQLDKPALIAALRRDDENDEEARLTRNDLERLGFKVRQVEEFFIDRLPPKPALSKVEGPAATDTLPKQEAA